MSLLSLLASPFVIQAQMSSEKYSISEDSISGIEITDILSNDSVRRVDGESDLSSGERSFNPLDYSFQILIIAVALTIILFMFLRFRKKRF